LLKKTYGISEDGQQLRPKHGGTLINKYEALCKNLVLNCTVVLLYGKSTTLVVLKTLSKPGKKSKTEDTSVIRQLLGHSIGLVF
jgi:hypothetical protein